MGNTTQILCQSLFQQPHKKTGNLFFSHGRNFNWGNLNIVNFRHRLPIHETIKTKTHHRNGLMLYQSLNWSQTQVNYLRMFCVASQDKRLQDFYTGCQDSCLKETGQKRNPSRAHNTKGGSSFFGFLLIFYLFFIYLFCLFLFIYFILFFCLSGLAILMQPQNTCVRSKILSGCKPTNRGWDPVRLLCWWWFWSSRDQLQLPVKRHRTTSYVQ